jgi:membrane fusion protein, multidrug efflux system
MRLLHIVSALAVCFALYLIVFERDTLRVMAAAEVATPAEPVIAAPAAEDGPRAVHVLVRKSEAQAVDSAVLARGRTEAVRQVEVRAETAGLVISEPLRKGAYVTAGQTLCELDPGTLGAAKAEAEARLAEAQINFDAAAKLSKDGFASETRAVSANAALQSATAAVANVTRQIEKLTIRAPFEGLLETDTAELGALLQPGAPCATVIQLNPIKLVGYVSEAEVDKVTVGAMAGARLINGNDVVGRVSFLSRSADPNTRTFRIEVLVDNADLTIRDGQTAEMMIAAEGRRAHLLPGSALTLDDTGRLGLRVVDGDQRAQFVPVSVLRDTSDGVWITGLDDMADVIVLGQDFVIDGVPVTVTYQEPDQ